MSSPPGAWAPPPPAPGGRLRFGTPQLYPDYGVLVSCRIDLTTLSGERLAVSAHLDTAAEVEQITGDREALGDLEIRRPVASDTVCDRWIVLADGSGVQLLVSRTAAGAADLCAVADAVTTSAAAVLADAAPLPTRTVPAPTDRLIALDGCALPDEATLSSVPGLDVGRRAVGFGGWHLHLGLPAGHLAPGHRQPPGALRGDGGRAQHRRRSPGLDLRLR